jgi:outer membrane protein TolC
VFAKQIRFVVLLGLIPTALSGCTRYRREPLNTALIQEQLQRVSLDDVSSAAQSIETKALIDPSKGLDADGIAIAALMLNPTLKAKRIEKGIAAGQLVQAGLWPNPEFDNRSHWQTDGHGRTLEAALAFEVLRWNERAAEKQASKANIEAVNFDILSEEWKVVSDARLAYWNVAGLQQKKVIAQQALSLADRLAQIAAKRLDAKVATALDRNLAELDLSKLKLELLQVEAELRTSQALLAQIVGVSPGVEIKLQITKPSYSTLPNEWHLEQMIAALPNSAAIKAAEWRYEIAEGDLRAAIARQYPSLKIGPSGEFDYDGSWTSFLGAVVAVDIPLFHRNQCEIKSKLAHREQARAEFTAQLFERQAQLSAAVQNVRALEIQLGFWNERLIPQTDESIKLSERSFETGVIDVQTLLRAQASVIDTKRKYAEILIDYHRAVQAIETALGSKLAPKRDFTPRPALQKSRDTSIQTQP